MLIKVDTGAFVPLYEQVKTEIRRLAALGAVKPNDPLPSIRELAAEVLVNPNTVARAYRELEQEGLIYTQKGRGSFLSARRERGLDRERGRVPGPEDGRGRPGGRDVRAGARGDPQARRRQPAALQGRRAHGRRE